MGYSFRLTARVLLYAPSLRQDNTYHALCYTSHGALAGMRNSLMGPAHEGSIWWPIAPWANALTTELHLVSSTRKRGHSHLTSSPSSFKKTSSGSDLIPGHEPSILQPHDQWETLYHLGQFYLFEWPDFHRWERVFILWLRDWERRKCHRKMSQ